MSRSAASVSPARRSWRTRRRQVVPDAPAFPDLGPIVQHGVGGGPAQQRAGGLLVLDQRGPDDVHTGELRLAAGSGPGATRPTVRSSSLRGTAQSRASSAARPACRSIRGAPSAHEDADGGASGHFQGGGRCLVERPAGGDVAGSARPAPPSAPGASGPARRRAAPATSDPPAPTPRITRAPASSCRVAMAATVTNGWRMYGLVTTGPTARRVRHPGGLGRQDPGVAPPEGVGHAEPVGAGLSAAWAPAATTSATRRVVDVEVSGRRS